MKIHRTVTDEYNSYGRKYLFDKKSADWLNACLVNMQTCRTSISETKESIKKLCNDMELEQEGSAQYNTIGEEAKAAEDYLTQEQEKLEALQKELDEFLSSLPRAKYDRYQLDDNIRNYLEITETQLGEIEIEGTLSKGGLSRWEKNIMTSELPLSFLLAAAEKFGVTLQELLYGDPTRRSADDDDIIQFIENLQQLTKKDKIRWEEVVPEDRRSGVKQVINPLKPRLYRDVEGVFYNSGFRYGGPFKADKPSFSTKLPDSDDIVFLYSIDFTETPGHSGMELYINVGEGDEQPVCSTYAANSLINYMLVGLYNVAEQSSRKVGLGSIAKSSMERLVRYMEMINSVYDKKEK